MMRIDIYDPAMCCSTGVCGADVDPQLVQFAADVKWLGAQGVDVQRYNLGQEPETTPVLEAEGLQSDLRRAGIEPYAWIINQSLAAARTSDPLLAARAASEHALIQRVQHELAERCAIVPMKAESPVGATRLRELVAGVDTPEHSHV